jgi:hypothetical protein
MSYSKMAPKFHDDITYGPDSQSMHELDPLRPSVASTIESSGQPRSAPASINRTHEEEAKQPLVHHAPDPSDSQAHATWADGEAIPQSTTWKRRYRYKSWKVAVLTNSVTATVVLLGNCILTIWASLHFGFDRSGGHGVAYVGDCDTVAGWSRWLHVVINVLSTMLFSASHYTMQCAAAPTRSECDEAHARGDWLCIGAPNVRNPRKLGGGLVYYLLALSGTPIHLLYNSAVFKTTDNNAYSAVVAGEDFLSTSYNVTTIDSLSRQVHRAYMADPASWANLTRSECVQNYTNYVISGRTDVIAISLKKYPNDQARTVNKDSTDTNSASGQRQKLDREGRVWLTNASAAIVPKLCHTYDW